VDLREHAGKLSGTEEDSCGLGLDAEIGVEVCDHPRRKIGEAIRRAVLELERFRKLLLAAGRLR
jgi:hypothetical protein